MTDTGVTMQVGIYTNLVLTVIAFALVGLVIQNAIPPADAQVGEIIRVAVCDPDGYRCARIGAVGQDGRTVDALVTVDVSTSNIN